ncbi:MAG: dTDP-4-dehydrorhamnose reductase [Rhodocyclaceae bacterium]
MTRIVVTGATGQVGWELARSLLTAGEVLTPSRAEFDLTNPGSMRQYLRRIEPDVIVNPAAYTAVDRAESEPELARRINAEAPGVIAAEARRIGALLIHYSTDYVFDGAKTGPYREDDETAPQSVYGHTKLDGEKAVQDSGAAFLVLRTSWVFAARGKNFLRTILRLAAERVDLRVVADQFGAPTWARLIADATAVALNQALADHRSECFDSGVYHLAAQGETSWHGFSSRILALAGAMPDLGPLRVQRIEPITTQQYPAPAQRPANSCLSSEAFMSRFRVELPQWQECVQPVLDEIAATRGTNGNGAANA